MLVCDTCYFRSFASSLTQMFTKKFYLFKQNSANFPLATPNPNGNNETKHHQTLQHYHKELQLATIIYHFLTANSR